MRSVTNENAVLDGFDRELLVPTTRTATPSRPHNGNGDDHCHARGDQSNRDRGDSARRMCGRPGRRDSRNVNRERNWKVGRDGDAEESILMRVERRPGDDHVLTRIRHRERTPVDPVTHAVQLNGKPRIVPIHGPTIAVGAGNGKHRNLVTGPGEFITDVEPTAEPRDHIDGSPSLGPSGRNPHALDRKLLRTRRPNRENEANSCQSHARHEPSSKRTHRLGDSSSTECQPAHIARSGTLTPPVGAAHNVPGPQVRPVLGVRPSGLSVGVVADPGRDENRRRPPLRDDKGRTSATPLTPGASRRPPRSWPRLVRRA
jgi:hypothetical protein